VLDFGLASWAAPVSSGDVSTKTADPFAGATDIAGTMPYMSPEQATGRAVDGRSDMFSLGIVLYELISGGRPFSGDNVIQLIEALLQQDVPPLVPRIDDPRLPSVERVVRRMLEKMPARRYDNLRAAADALDAAGRDQAEAWAAPGTDGRPPILAVTDFRNITANAEDDWLGTGMAETISADLGSLEGITVIPRGRVHELIRTLGHESGGSDDLVRLRAGRQLGARWVLAGSFQRAAQAVRVTASLIDVPSGSVAHTIKVDGQLTEIFALQDRLVRDLADGVRAVMRPGDGVPQDTGIVGAYEAFSKGVVNLQAETYESLDRAVMLFERAVALDARYARAHLELGVAYSTKADYLAMADLRPSAEASLRRALELQPGAVRGWRELGLLLIAMGREPEGFEAIEHALQLDADDAGALGAMARALFVGRAQFRDAAAWYDKALAANPNGGWYALQLSHCAALLREFARGEAAATRAVALQQAFLSGREGVLIVGASMRLGHLEALQRRHARAVDYFLREIEFLSSVDHALRNRIIVELNVRLGAAYLALGQSRKGQAVLDVAIEGFDRRVRLGADEPFTRYYAAAAHALKGDADAAIAFLERAASERRAFTIERARIEPEFDRVREDPRFRKLLAV
jgi:TolB-like protein/tetratricopeptide (TPR) repeat protein